MDLVGIGERKEQLVVAGEHFRDDVAQELLDVRGVGGASALYSLAKFVAYLHGCTVLMRS